MPVPKLIDGSMKLLKIWPGRSLKLQTNFGFRIQVTQPSFPQTPQLFIHFESRSFPISTLQATHFYLQVKSYQDEFIRYCSFTRYFSSCIGGSCHDSSWKRVCRSSSCRFLRNWISPWGTWSWNLLQCTYVKPLKHLSSWRTSFSFVLRVVLHDVLTLS